MEVKMFALLCLAAVADSANILITIPFIGRSHYISTRSVGLELARRGHHVYVITSITEKEETPPTYHEVVVDYVTNWELMGIEPPNINNMEEVPFSFFIALLNEAGLLHAEWSYNSTKVQEFLAQNHKIDLVICEVFFYDTFYMMSHYFDAPLVLLTTFGNSFRTNYFTRNPLQLSTILHEYGEEADPSSFWGRLKNLYYFAYEMTLYNLYYGPKNANLAKKYLKNLPEPIPSMPELISKASLVLMNSHFSADVPTAYLPNVVEVGGLHIRNETKKLPKDLQDFMDSAEHGVVLVSFGSVLSSSDLSEDKRSAMLRVFGTLRQKVLMKWEDQQLPGKPSNVEIRSWLPQRELLAHPNMKLFIAHGGLIGIQEATHYGVPVLGIPVYGDQLNNIIQAKKLGYAEVLEFKQLNEENLSNAVKKMLDNDKYNKKAKEVSARFTDRPLSALDTAMYWIEYVLRHKGAEFIRSPGVQLSLIEYYMLDVGAFLVALILLIVFVFIKIIKLCTGKKSKTNHKLTKKTN